MSFGDYFSGNKLGRPGPAGGRVNPGLPGITNPLNPRTGNGGPGIGRPGQGRPIRTHPVQDTRPEEWQGLPRPPEPITGPIRPGPPVVTPGFDPGFDFKGLPDELWYEYQKYRKNTNWWEHADGIANFGDWFEQQYGHPFKPRLPEPILRVPYGGGAQTPATVNQMPRTSTPSQAFGAGQPSMYFGPQSSRSNPLFSLLGRTMDMYNR